MSAFLLVWAAKWSVRLNAGIIFTFHLEDLKGSNMGILDGILSAFSGSSSEDSDYYETGTCPNCGSEMHRRYSYSGWWCDTCHNSPYGECDDDDGEGESISVYDAADIWMSNGKDEDYMFGYTREELEDAL